MSEEYGSTLDYAIPPCQFEEWRATNWISAKECPTVWRRRLSGQKEVFNYLPVAIQECLNLGDVRRHWRVLYRHDKSNRSIWLQVQSKG